MKKLMLLLISLAFCCSCSKSPRPVLMDEVKQLAGLATTEFVFTKYFIINKENKLLGLIKLGSATAVVQSEATLKLGFDVSQMNGERVTIQDDRVSLQLPSLKVISFNYPIEKFELLEKYSDPEKKLRLLHSEDWDEYYRQSESVLREHLNYLDILPEAHKRTDVLIRSFLRQLGYKNISIEFDPAEEPLF